MLPSYLALLAYLAAYTSASVYLDVARRHLAERSTEGEISEISIVRSLPSNGLQGEISEISEIRSAPAIVTESVAARCSVWRRSMVGRIEPTRGEGVSRGFVGHRDPSTSVLRSTTGSSGNPSAKCAPQKTQLGGE